jgi:hypothetical protein
MSAGAISFELNTTLQSSPAHRIVNWVSGKHNVPMHLTSKTTWNEHQFHDNDNPPSLDVMQKLPVNNGESFCHGIDLANTFTTPDHLVMRP